MIRISLENYFVLLMGEQLGMLKAFKGDKECIGHP